jgi:hypothetical protein
MANSITYKAIGGLASNQYQTYCIEVAIDTYASNGVAIPFKSFEPTMVVGIENVSGTAVTGVFDLANGKLKLFSGTTEVSAGTITEVKFHLTFFGLLG